MAEVLKIKSHYNRRPDGLPEIKSSLNDYTWQEIKSISEKNVAELYGIKSGDTKSVEISGMVDGVDLTGIWDCFVIGVNHNEKVEGKGISFSFAKRNGKYLTFWGFSVNNSQTNAGGWENSKIRTATCSQLLSALPEELQSAIKYTSKYTDNVGGGTDVSSNVTVTQDKIFLLSEFEVQGKRERANSTEQNYQKQYEFFKSGNPKIRYQHTYEETTGTWFLRSPDTIRNIQFCSITSDGGVSGSRADLKFGFSPCFVI